MAYKERFYRSWVKSGDLVSFEVIEKETDILVSASRNLAGQAREAVLDCRSALEEYIERYPEFYSSLKPLAVGGDAPPIVKIMAEASRKAGVGPMAAVAGAIAEYVSRYLLELSDEVIVENGGDIFMKSLRPRTFGIYAGDSSPFTGKLVLEVKPYDKGVGICASSGTVSHSLSFGRADAALIISHNTALADAVATATGNIVKNSGDITKSVDFARAIDGIIGILVLVGDRMASWGEIKII